ACCGALPDDDVEAKVFERRIENLLDRRRQAVDLVDEQHVPGLESGENRREIALPLEGRACDAADADTELLSDDVGQAGLAEPRRPDEEHVIERLGPSARRLQRDLELLLDALLADELVQSPRPERAVEFLLCPVVVRGADKARFGHAAFLNARRTRSSGGR